MYYLFLNNYLNIELIAISTDDSRTQKRIKPMVNGKGWEYKILLDKNLDVTSIDIDQAKEIYKANTSKK